MAFFGGGGSTATMVGATASVAGSGGSVPAPAAGSEYAYLRGDATFKNPLIQSSYINTTQEGYPTNLFGLYRGGSITPANDILYLTPHIVIPSTYTKITLPRGSGTSGANMKVRMGVYNCDFDKLCPTDLVFETADTAMGSVASNVTVTISKTLNKGIYFLACVFTSSSGFLAVSPNMAYPTFWGTLRNTSSNTFNSLVGFHYSHSYGALPTTITQSSLTINASTVAVAELQKT